MKLKKFKQLSLTSNDAYFGDTASHVFWAGGDKFRIKSSLLLFSSPLGVTGIFTGDTPDDYESAETAHVLNVRPIQR